MDIEKVIKGLECCLANGHNNCPYKSTDEGIDKVISCTTYLMQDALALLKAHLPSVMTLDQLKALDNTDDTAYIERRKKTRYNETAFVHVETVYGEDITFHGQMSIFGHPTKEYGKTWRAWTSRPTFAQMESAPWE